MGRSPLGHGLKPLALISREVTIHVLHSKQTDFASLPDADRLVVVAQQS